MNEKHFTETGGCLCDDCRESLEILDSLVEVTEMLREAHQDEVENNHYGDGPEGCSYCKAIRRAEAIIEKVR
jgi:hypothetical protein